MPRLRGVKVEDISRQELIDLCFYLEWENKDISEFYEKENAEIATLKKLVRAYERIILLEEKTDG